MSNYDKIWVELEIEQDRDNKTKKIQEVLEHCSKIPCVKNVSKVTYQKDIEKLTIQTKEE